MIEVITRMFYPMRCTVCRQFMSVFDENFYICDECEQTAQKSENSVRCNKCSKTINITCSFCETENYNTSIRNISYLSYDKEAKILLHKLKYNKKINIIKVIYNLNENMIKQNVDTFDKFDIITSVPLHNARLKERGFNQSEKLAKLLAKEIHKPYVETLTRIKNTEYQYDKNYEQRQENVKDAFAMNERQDFTVKDKTILLCDDIFTTGSTVNACYDVLMKNGAKEVVSFCFFVSEKDKDYE